jgi:shikimate kinase
VDLDEYIEEKTGLTIAEIFDRCGESYFRDLESQAISEVTKQDGTVIATGGGAVLRYKNVQMMKRNGVVILLEVSPQAAFGRVQQDPKSPHQRPQLTPGPLQEAMVQELKNRAPYYEAAADMRVSTDEKDPETVTKEIWTWLEKGPLRGMSS